MREIDRERKRIKEGEPYEREREMKRRKDRERIKEPVLEERERKI